MKALHKVITIQTYVTDLKGQVGQLGLQHRFALVLLFEGDHRLLFLLLVASRRQSVGNGECRWMT